MNQRGITRERQVRLQLEEQGWVVSRCAGSKGNYDLHASRDAGNLHTECLLVEVKSTAGGPYERFGPTARAALRQAAAQAGATAWLAYWPKGGKLRWIGVDEWPE